MKSILKQYEELTDKLTFTVSPLGIGVYERKELAYLSSAGLSLIGNTIPMHYLKDFVKWLNEVVNEQ